ncbi:MAG: YhfC family intramembrane metalloprotease [Candidatus Heimdallarchaeota archaeon]|nr:YhfC family intramembrane metalloprotease [Candidatus Heimdallarchaeota archaeon]
MNYFLLIIEMIIIAFAALIVFQYVITSGERRLYLKAFSLGAAGWLIAYLIRLIPLQLIQIYFLQYYGADINDAESIALYVYKPLVIIWGPLFAGLFEGGFRYIFFANSRSCRMNRMKSPIIFGLGWGVGEAMFLLITGLINVLLVNPTLNIPLLNAVITLTERTSAIMLHISASVIIFYALYEKWPKVSLLLGMLLHMLFDYVIVVWIFVFADDDPLLWTLTLELALFITALIILVFTFKYYRKRAELTKRDEIEKFQAIEKEFEEMRAKVMQQYKEPKSWE